MKLRIVFIFFLLGMSSSFVSSIPCENINDSQDNTILEKIANANGFQNWRNITEIKFTFNVDRDTTHFERTWSWKPKTNDITATSAEEIISYNWSEMDSIANKTNAGFINDKFWLLTPYQLVWDADNISPSHFKEAKAPISNQILQKLTIVYGNEGGYTPGDAYDLYFNDEFIIQEWVFRKSNQKEPSMTTTFEDYKTIKGLKMATMHKMKDADFKLYFTDLEVK